MLIMTIIRFLSRYDWVSHIISTSILCATRTVSTFSRTFFKPIVIWISHPFSNDPRRCIRRTIRDCRRCRSSLAGCRFGRSGSSGFVVSFYRLRWFNRGFVLKVHSCRDRCRYRYICRPVGLPARGGCCSERIRLLLWGRMKNKNRVRATYTLRQDWRFYAGYDLLPRLIIA